MQLGVDYGTVLSRAVLTWPDGRWAVLLAEGAAALPSGVYVDGDGALWAGLAAQQRGVVDPDRFVAYPKRLVGQAQVQVAVRAVEVVELVAATLRRFGDETARVAGQPPDELTLTVPAGWGPNRRTILRRAATRAGLPRFLVLGLVTVRRPAPHATSAQRSSDVSLGARRAP